MLSPVIITTRIPAALQSLMAGLTSVRGGSNIPQTPTKVMSKKLIFRKNELTWISWSEGNCAYQIRKRQSWRSFPSPCLRRLVGYLPKFYIYSDYCILLHWCIKYSLWLEWYKTTSRRFQERGNEEYQIQYRIRWWELEFVPWGQQWMEPFRHWHGCGSILREHLEKLFRGVSESFIGILRVFLTYLLGHP